MVEDQIGNTHADHKANSDACEQSVQGNRKKFSLCWDYWTNHAIPFWCALFGGLLLTPLLDLPDMKPRQIWFVGLGVWVLLGAIIGFFCHSIVHHLTDTIEHDAAKREKQIEQHQQRIESKLEGLDIRLAKTEQVIEKQILGRSLSESQKALIKQALGVFRGQKIKVCSQAYDVEAKRYAESIRQILSEIGWFVADDGPANSLLPYSNLTVVVNPCHTSFATCPPVAIRVAHTFAQLGIMDRNGTIRYGKDLPIDEFQIWVGTRSI